MSPWIVLALELLLALAALVGVGVVGLARALLRPPRMTEGRAMYLLGRMSPADVGLSFEPLAFRTRGPGAIDLAAWWITSATARGRTASGRTVVLLHGYGDAKVGALAWAPTWHALGFNALVVDLRGHGESGGATSTAGFVERDDLDAVLDELRATRPAQARSIVLFGVSLGGAVALACAARRADIAGVVVDGVYRDYPTAVAAHARRLGAPLASLLPATLRLAERMGGARFADVRPVETIAACACPVMLIQAGRDAFVDVASRDALSAALASRANARDVEWTVADAGHGLPLAADPAGYAARVGAFVSAVL